MQVRCAVAAGFDEDALVNEHRAIRAVAAKGTVDLVVESQSFHCRGRRVGDVSQTLRKLGTRRYLNIPQESPENVVEGSLAGLLIATTGRRQARVAEPGYVPATAEVTK